MSLTKLLIKEVIQNNVPNDQRKQFVLFSEAVYNSNMGFEEMMKFYDIATDDDIQKVEDLIEKEKFKEAWKIIQSVTGVTLKGSNFN